MDQQQDSEERIMMNDVGFIFIYHINIFYSSLNATAL